MTGPSRTAEYMALFRAIESGRSASSRLFDDPFARRFLPPGLRTVAAASGIPGPRALVPRIIDRRWPGPRASAVVRTRLIDDAVVVALQAGIRQVVILGAGFDSRGVRLPGIDTARVIEVDHPDTQLVKRSRLEQALGVVPANLAFAPVDFEHDDLVERLHTAGYRNADPTAVVWEGVTNYLSADAVDRTFRTLAANMPSASRVIFTYVHRGALDGSVNFDEASRWAGAVRNVGEPFTFGFEPAELGDYLTTRGFALSSDTSTADAGPGLLGPLGRDEPASQMYHVAVAARRAS